MEQHALQTPQPPFESVWGVISFSTRPKQDLIQKKISFKFNLIIFDAII
jgi:hypothetical protein